MPISHENVSFTDIQEDTYLQILFFYEAHMEDKAFAPGLHTGKTADMRIGRAHTFLLTNRHQILTKHP